ncbi:MAG: orotate phosphoribosyltransferase, partial [Actinomycetota bacterium]|nr:orotate phosphoribosyltransferase [Actinomycetota bacterium]
TRGTSPLEAASVVRALGAEVVAVLPIVDRGGTCGAVASEAGIEFRPLVTAPDLGFPYEGP